MYIWHGINPQLSTIRSPFFLLCMINSSFFAFIVSKNHIYIQEKCIDSFLLRNVDWNLPHCNFILTRCYEGNLIEIPVEVETPDHHYYHVLVIYLSLNAFWSISLLLRNPCNNYSKHFFLMSLQIAFFTTRKVNALEELTWVKPLSMLNSITIRTLSFWYRKHELSQRSV